MGRDRKGKTMKISISQVIMFLALLTGAFSGPTSFSQDSQVDAEPEASLLAEGSVEPEQLPYITIEEIRVTAERSAFVLRRQFEETTRNFIAGYNDVNDVEEFGMSCKKSGTHIQRQVCMPVFYERALADAAQTAFLTGDFAFVSSSAVAFNERPKFEQLQNHILQLALEHPDLVDTLLELGKIQAALEAKKDECMAKPGFLGIFRLCR